MRVGKKKYKISYCFKKWFKSQFSDYKEINNRQCAFGIRCSAYKGNIFLTKEEAEEKLKELNKNG